MMAKSDNGWDQRMLCPDGNCIGIIGADGRCKECGTPYDGERPSPEADSDTADDGVDDPSKDPQTTGEDDVDAEVTPVEPQAADQDDAWEDRTLCIDESCIGIVGPDGRCNTCGKPYPG